ncbi:amidohydrolase family protein [Nonomuraea endophytica]|uniref:Putative TIM-barrel fold metal-dependent hydrolase n=1 Tax=Nonomuraea endophytica TaxID=714136 RepID=A0A7W8ABP0_9ACTN|nr:amidohydrolase family protein [Nonomuraea endophytica]MBB5082161.1 putative TIM-barrel fold metal-dependent hydrolase [Nonomuraea endophytica]
MIIDSHVHVGTWKYPEISAYLPELAEVDAAVLVQFVGNTDNSYLLRCAEAHPGRFAVIAMVDTETHGAPAHVARLAASPHVKGVRLWAATRSPGPDPYALWRAIAAAGLVASVRGPLADIADPAFATLLDEVPGLTVRLEHLGFTTYPDADPAHFSGFLALAERPLVHTMWAGFHANSGRPYPHPDADPFLREAVAAYGARRITWSGDWNRPDPAPGDYKSAINHVLERPYLTDEDKRWILGGASAALFGMGG